MALIANLVVSKIEIRQPWLVGGVLLELRRHRHHVRITKNVISSDGGEMMYESDYLAVDESAERPSAGTIRNDQVPPR